MSHGRWQAEQETRCRWYAGVQTDRRGNLLEASMSRLKMLVELGRDLITKSCASLRLPFEIVQLSKLPHSGRLN